MSLRLSLHKQLCKWVAEGTCLLDAESRMEVKMFISSLQNSDGGFADRAGDSDLYYSLFAHFILKSFPEKEYQSGLKKFVAERGKRTNNHLVDACCLAILNKDLNGNRLHGLNYFFSALKIARGGNYDGSLPYQYFLLFLMLDAYGFNNRLTRWFARSIFKDVPLVENIPCPALAAQLVFKQQLGFDIHADRKKLLTYFSEGMGFKVFPEAKTADLLSTAVALFALKNIGHNIALLAPECLQLIENCYADGAFLSGDGDESRDAEYTFYGLLALGVMGD